jgi:hypothetical protein
MVLAAPAAASPPEEITIEGPSYFDGSGEFTTTGVDGLLCPAGSFSDLESRTSPKHSQSPQRINMQIRREYVCADGTGTFVLKLQVHIPVNIDENNWPTFTWVVVGGTADYAELKGTGSGFAAFPIFNGEPWPIGVFDVCHGQVHTAGR